MKRTFIALALICVAAFGIASCTAQHGCRATQGYVGYGSK